MCPTEPRLGRALRSGAMEIKKGASHLCPLLYRNDLLITYSSLSATNREASPRLSSIFRYPPFFAAAINLL